MKNAIICKFRKGPIVLVSRGIAYTFPLSYAYLAGYLKEKAEDVRVLFRNSDLNTLVKQIMTLNPLLVGFGSLYPELQEIKEIITLLNKAGRQFPVVIGGQMVSPTPEFSVKITGADIGVSGEGEIPLFQLAQALRGDEDLSNVKGISVRENDKVFVNDFSESTIDMAELPAIPYELFPEKEWLQIGRWYAYNAPQPHWRYNDRVINVHGGRGCPFKCNFCYHHSKPRYRPIPQMIAEGTETLERFNGNMLYFSDDLVLANPKRGRELVQKIRSIKKPFEYSISARFDILAKIDDQLLSELRDTGCRIMGLGIESGSDRILNLIGKNCTTDMIYDGLERLRTAGILPTVSIMVGQHTETREDVEASIDLMKKTVRNNPNIQYAFTITTPFPGSPLYNLILKKGYINDHKEFYDKYFSTREEWKQVVNLSEMSDEEVLLMYQKIKKAYKDEKTKTSGRTVIMINYSQVVLGHTYKIFCDKLFSKLPSNGFLIKIRQGIQNIYDFVQVRLETFRLKLEKL